MGDEYLIKNTTREQREKIVADAIGNVSGLCDGCASGYGEKYYQPYIDGKLEINELNRQFETNFIMDDGPEPGGRSCMEEF